MLPVVFGMSILAVASLEFETAQHRKCKIHHPFSLQKHYYIVMPLYDKLLGGSRMKTLCLLPSRGPSDQDSYRLQFMGK